MWAIFASRSGCIDCEGSDAALAQVSEQGLLRGENHGRGRGVERCCVLRGL
jgi:hypothetical protein